MARNRHLTFAAQCGSLAIALAAGMSAALPARAETTPLFASSVMTAGEVACSDLTALRIPDVRITQATAIQPDPVWMIPHPRPVDIAAEIDAPLCRVEGVIEDEIRFELWLPERGSWNGRMLGTGNGGFAGFFRYDGLAHGLQRGFAALTTDTGHRLEERHWSIGHPRRLENYGHRGQHLAAVNTKQVIAAFYGQNPHHSYFMGCSGGGMQAMNEAQRYPADYDGIIAGAHGSSIVGISARWLESALVGRNRPGVRLSRADWSAIASAAVDQCDGDDGIIDQVIANPRMCSFSPHETPGLSAAKAETAERLLGPIRAADGTILFEGYQPGIVYPALDDPARAGEVFAEWFHGDPAWDFTLFNAARDIPLVENAVPGSSFRNADLSAFARRGGKLISYHGWDDGIVPGDATISYFDRVQHTMGPDTVSDFYRLYMVPGMDHCGGGVGADTFGQNFLRATPYEATPANDVLMAMVQWVEQGQAPQIMTSAKLDKNEVVYTRPLCPYPKVSKYSGTGDPSQAASFICEDP